MEKLSKELLEKWRSLMVRKYNFDNPTDKEVLEFSSDLTKYFEVLLEPYQPVDKIH